ncbi:MAG: hypothetical protein ACRC30_09920 [Clostridium sp.]
MSNTIVLIANSYSEFCNKRNNNSISNNNNGNLTKIRKFFSMDKWIVIMFLAVVIGLGIFILGAIINKSIEPMIFGLALYIIGLILMVRISEKNEIKNYKDRRKKYYRKLSGFNKVLKYEFKIDTREKMEYILKACEEESSRRGQDINLVTRFLSSWKTIIFPIITMIMTAILGVEQIKKSITWQGIVVAVMIVFSIIVMIMIALSFLDSVLEPFKNSDKNRIETLNNVLKDIYLLEYM